jgi:hypothetical protein
VIKMSLQNQPEHTEQWKMNSEWTAQNGTRYKLSNKWKTTKMTRFGNTREERVDHYTTRMYLLPAYRGRTGYYSPSNKKVSWSVHCNFTGEGNSSERGWACTPHPHQPGLILPSSLNVRQKAAVATLCTLWS